MTDNALEGSRVVAFVRWCRSVFRALLKPLKRLGGRLGRYVRGSYIYRWLTAEPEPEVIVIDLRETYTVGPVIRALDRVIRTLEESYSGSRTEAFSTSAAEAFHARPVRLLGAVGIAFATVWILATAATGALSAGLFAGQLLVAVGSLLALRSTRSLEEVLEMRAVSAFVSAFEPPDPPASANETAQSRSSAPAETTRSPNPDEAARSSNPDQTTRSPGLEEATRSLEDSRDT